MTLATQVLRILGCVSLAGCVSTPFGQRMVTDPAELAQHKDGAHARVRGYLVFESHARQLWASQAALGSNEIEHCFTLIDTRAHQGDLSRLNRSFVVIYGKVFRDVSSGYVDYGACGRTGILVETVMAN